jgi:hypothetical protein
MDTFTHGQGKPLLYLKMTTTHITIHNFIECSKAFNEELVSFTSTYQGININVPKKNS